MVCTPKLLFTADTISDYPSSNFLGFVEVGRACPQKHEVFSGALRQDQRILCIAEKSMKCVIDPQELVMGGTPKLSASFCFQRYQSSSV